MVRHNRRRAVESPFRRFRQPATFSVHFSTLLVPGRPAKQEPSRRLLWALATSLVWHLVGLLVCEVVFDAVGETVRHPVASPMRVTLHAGGSREASTVPASRLADVAQPQSKDANQRDVDQRTGSPRPADLVIALGSLRLRSELPPYLVQPYELDLPPGPWYFSRAVLTAPPVLLKEPLLVFPERRLSDEEMHGLGIVLRILVAADGAVDRVEVLRSTLPAVYEEVVVEALARAVFRPAEVEGVAVTSEARYELTFEGHDSGSSHATDTVVIRESSSDRIKRLFFGGFGDGGKDGANVTGNPIGPAR